MDFGFAFRPSDNGRPAALTHQRGGTHRPDALPPPDNAGIDRVDIYLVDTVCRMAVFAFSNDRKTERFQSLYVPFETGLEMDMIDFHSLELPDESEVEWDETDFEALISGAVPLRETDPKTDKTNNE